MSHDRTSVRTGWVVASSRRLALDPGRAFGVISLEAEFDRSLGQWVATASISPLTEPFQAIHGLGVQDVPLR